jgi:hypothetical protein
MSLLHEIRELLAAPKPADSQQLLDQLDERLTAGYAYVLQLEAERWRAERQIGEVAAHIAAAPDDDRVDELADLARRLNKATEDIAALRTLLVSLRDRRRELRQAA